MSSQPAGLPRAARDRQYTPAAQRQGDARALCRAGHGWVGAAGQGGGALYFVAGSAILSSAVTTQPELRFGASRIILNDPLLVQAGAGTKAFAVAPDGGILVIKEDRSIRSDHVVVVQNWLSEVRERKSREQP